MIIRPLILRHGRLALPKGTPRRYLASAPSTTTPPTSPNPSTHTLEIHDPTSPIAQRVAFFQHQKAQTSHLGSTLSPYYKPRDLLTNPPRPQDITLELLLASQTHLGHATSLWNPANAQYIFGVRGKHDPIHVIGLDVTAAHLRRACKVVSGVTARGGLVLFVGTRTGQAGIVVRAAELAGACHLFTKWTPGSITNGQQILGSCSKKVVDETDTEILGFADQLALSPALKPDLVICLNPLENYILLHECAQHNIPTIGIIDTDADPTHVTYPIPANDDSLRAVQVICGALGRAGEEGQAERMERAGRGVVSSMPDHGLVAPTPGQAEREREAKELEARLAEQIYEQEIEAAAFKVAGGEEEVLETGAEGGELDPSLRSEEEGDVYDDVVSESYARDQPLSDAELAQAPQASGRRLQDWEVEEMKYRDR